ncbi:winged-helix domain-containing protein [Halomicrobium salinisoli]|uniref:winged-helix domain-containing protein n=1 Tax=Halomicrobium salinisoli TaxID=2878391 RepID=UPI001CF09CCF|nr:winged-helix domain-containing protein [Halomicrobium salinisoli]
MGKEERQRKILELLDTSELALPPKPIYVNLQLQGATFGERTVNRHLSEMEEEGYVEKIDDRRGYYRITDAGRDLLNQESQQA